MRSDGDNLTEGSSPDGGGSVKAGGETNGSTNPWERFSVSALEADIAYFQARLELIGKPGTINQKGQVTTFRNLVHAMTRILNRLKRKEPGRTG